MNPAPGEFAGTLHNTVGRSHAQIPFVYVQAPDEFGTPRWASRRLTWSAVWEEHRFDYLVLGPLGDADERGFVKNRYPTDSITSCEGGGTLELARRSPGRETTSRLSERPNCGLTASRLNRRATVRYPHRPPPCPNDGRELALPFVEVAPPRVRQMATSSDGRPTFSDGEASGAALDGMRRVFRMELAAAPDATRPLSAGSYQIVASLQTPAWQFWGWRGRVESAPLVVTVVTTETADRQLAGTATFLYKTRQFDEAVRAARDWSARDAASIRARILLGDALLATGDRAGARDAYEAALDLANAASSNERPTAILERLDKLRTRTR